MKPPARREIATELAVYDSLLEVGIGRRPEVATELADAGCSVIAIDTNPETVSAATSRIPPSVTVREADIIALANRDSVPDVYHVDAVYGVNLPGELQTPAKTLAARIDADFIFTTLGFEEPLVPVEQRSLDNSVLYVASGRIT